MNSQNDDERAHIMRMNGMSPSGFPTEPEPISYFMDSEIGLTMGDTKVEQLPDGMWRATAPIGNIFGSEVEGECSGEGPTKEAALDALAKDRKNLSDSLWA